MLLLLFSIFVAPLLIYLVFHSKQELLTTIAYVEVQEEKLMKRKNLNERASQELNELKMIREYATNAIADMSPCKEKTREQCVLCESRGSCYFRKGGDSNS